MSPQKKVLRTLLSIDVEMASTCKKTECFEILSNEIKKAMKNGGGGEWICCESELSEKY